MAESPAAAEKGKGKGKAVQADPMEESEDSESEASGVEDEVRSIPQSPYAQLPDANITTAGR